MFWQSAGKDTPKGVVFNKNACLYAQNSNVEVCLRVWLESFTDIEPI
jgi:hypothetical protein